MICRPYIDAVKFPCKCDGVMTRVPEVLDVWYDAGAMPYAQVHYPFEKGVVPDFPADYISGEWTRRVDGFTYYLRLPHSWTARAVQKRNLVRTYFG